MSVRYTAMWYDVMQAHHSLSCYSACNATPPPTHRPACTLSTPVLARPVYLAVPARPALNRGGRGGTAESSGQYTAEQSARWVDRDKMADQCC